MVFRFLGLNTIYNEADMAIVDPTIRVKPDSSDMFVSRKPLFSVIGNVMGNISG